VAALPLGVTRGIGHAKVMTLAGKPGSEGLLAFVARGDVDRTVAYPVRIEVEFGMGKIGDGPRVGERPASK
jgi:hypothetical protein